jgi:hypothetical protein
MTRRGFSELEARVRSDGERVRDVTYDAFADRQGQAFRAEAAGNCLLELPRKENYLTLDATASACFTRVALRLAGRSCAHLGTMDGSRDALLMSTLWCNLQQHGLLDSTPNRFSNWL